MSQSIKIGRRSVGHGQPTFVIAEIGSNHDRDISQAMRLIDVAADAGADAAKFQLYTANDLYPTPGPIHDAVKATELPVDWVPRLAAHASGLGLEFLASVFSLSAVDVMAEVRTPAYKIASSDAVNLPLLKYAASKRVPMIVSTGMCDLADITDAIEVIRGEGNEEIVLLQCTALYPTPPKLVNLRAMDTMRDAFRIPVGFSDHTLDTTIPVAAVARGACMIEKHLTPDRSKPGPDHSYALEPAEFKRMVAEIRAVEASFGEATKAILPEEAVLARRASVRAARDIQRGEELTAEAVVVERRAGGVAPRLLAAVIGQRASARIEKGAPITWEVIRS